MQRPQGTKNSIKYRIYYLIPGLRGLRGLLGLYLRRIQVSLDKSKSLQYNLKKWVVRLKLVAVNAAGQPHPEQL